jgi:intracellular sulfur oxidation DsrE/DsrF family protein
MKNNLNNNIMRTKIENFLANLKTEIDVLYFVDIDNIDMSNPFDSICKMIEDNNGFDIDVIYYSNAIDYLSKNDPSLKKSLNIAAELCYEVQNLNSEILASLLASKLVREEFYELESEINDFFEELEEEEEEE